MRAAGNEGKSSGDSQPVNETWSRRALLVAAVGLGAGALVACATREPTAPSPESPIVGGPSSPETTKGPEGLHNKTAQHRAAQVISTFENSTTEIQYGFAANLNDGRGITAGRAGFCSGTGDMLMVIEQYTQNNPDNVLAKYLAPLTSIHEKFVAADHTPVDDTTGLAGLEMEWKKTANRDEKFREAQDAVVNQLYLNPAIKRAKDLGINSAIGQLIIFDTNIQHGEGNDPDGLPAILAEAKEKFSEDAPEEQKLQIILDVRKDHLLHAANPDTRDKWKTSVSRVTDGLQVLLDANNPDLTKKMQWSVYGDSFSLDAVN